MTCIVGLKIGEKVWIGCDSEATWGWEKHEASKMLSIDGLRMAWTGMAAVSVAIRYRLEVPRIPEGDEEHYLAVVLPDAIRETLKGMELWDSSGAVRGGGALLVGFRSHLYSYDSHMAGYPAARGITAHGSGGPVALGALHALGAAGLESGADRVRMAVEAASVWAVGVGGTPVVEEVPQ
jgi:ATP-dependent protease HslVU (ClpYQ) peptidase subunit